MKCWEKGAENRPRSFFMVRVVTLLGLILGLAPVSGDQIPAFCEERLENYTFRLTQSDRDFTVWTTLPSERVFKEDPVPGDSGDEIKLYCARNEFEPFLVVVRPSAGISGRISVTMSDFGNEIETEINQFRYVYISQATDTLGKTGYYPDPLWPVASGSSVELNSEENTPFWITVHVPGTVPSGDYTALFTLTPLDGSHPAISVPVHLHVFNFSIPDELHVKSQMNFSHETILNSYGVSCCGDEYWKYVDMIKQYFIDHRLTPKGVLWSGGLTSGGGAPYIDYDCAGGTLTDNDGIWGFDEPARRYLDGDGLMRGEFESSFNKGVGFPSFMVATFRSNDSSEDQRPPLFCGVDRSVSDWYENDNPSSEYNRRWFSYISSLESYLAERGYLDKAYFYIANEPQDQADYDAVAWYSRELKRAAPDLKLMVSEEAKPEIYDNSSYPGAKIDIWLSVLENFDPEVAAKREVQYGEESWIYWLHGTRPPYFNPITLDHPRIESKLTGWFLWKYRIRGIAYYSLNNWSRNPWTDPMTDFHNGDLFMLYPPSESNLPISYGSNNHRFVPSVRFELMRDSLEDYEYLYLLNNSKVPVSTPVAASAASLKTGIVRADAVVDGEQIKIADTEASKVVYGTASYTRDSGFIYNLRRLIGLKNGGEISEIPDIEPEPVHPRSEGTPGNYYINFQNPDETFSVEPEGNPVMRDEIVEGVSYRILDYGGRSYYAIGADAYDEDKGFGWFGNIVKQPGESRDPWGSEKDERKRTYIYDDYGRVNTFEFALPDGTYRVSLCSGTPRKSYAHNSVRIEGVPFIDDESNSYFIERSAEVTVADSSLTLEIGITGMDEYTMLNYLEIEAEASNPSTWAPDIDVPDVNLVLDDRNSGCTAVSGKVSHIFGTADDNHVTVERGAWAKLVNFQGSNRVTVESDSSFFSITRSGATVTFVGNDGMGEADDVNTAESSSNVVGTVLVLPASAVRQKVEFTLDNSVYDLFTDSGRVMFGETEIRPESAR